MQPWLTEIMQDERYITIPNLFTSINLFCGFVSVTLTVAGDYSAAAWLIVIAGIIDAFDGSVARLLNQRTEFGLEMDSLGDVISAGVAPSVLVYVYHFRSLGHRGVLGLILAFMPLLFATFRLARFNVLTYREGKKRDFCGMPAPMAAATLASAVIMAEYTGLPVFLRAMVVLVPCVSLLMVSRLEFAGYPRFTLRERGRNRTRLIVLMITIVCAFFFPEPTLFTAMMIYLVSGPVLFIKERTAKQDR